VTANRYALRASREPGSRDDLDFFPTPPWATRAFLEKLEREVDASIPNRTAWEPACGQGHMAIPLAERFRTVSASDIMQHVWTPGTQATFKSYGSWPPGPSIDFLDMRMSPAPDWIITNPPFNLAADFAVACRSRASIGFALLVRSVWAESIGRYDAIFREMPPTHIWQFAERVPMAKGRWIPAGSTATAYSWFVWDVRKIGSGTEFGWIPPGQRALYHRESDVDLFNGGDA